MSDKQRLVESLRGKRPDKLAAKLREGRKGGGGGSGDRRYTYRMPIDCGNGTTAGLTYILRGDNGSYTEDFCDDALSGTLRFVTEMSITYEDYELRGYVYNGRDELGEWGYMFGTEDLGGGSYILMFGEPYVQGQEPALEPVAVCTRTSP